MFCLCAACGDVQNASLWQDVDIVCGDCTVFTSTVNIHKTCRAYCASQGLLCTDSWEEVDNSCTPQFQTSCEFDFTSLDTSDMLCQCGATFAPTAVPTLTLMNGA